MLGYDFFVSIRSYLICYSTFLKVFHTKNSTICTRATRVYIYLVNTDHRQIVNAPVFVRTPPHLPIYYIPNKTIYGRHACIVVSYRHADVVKSFPVQAFNLRPVDFFSHIYVFLSSLLCTSFRLPVFSTIVYTRLKGRHSKITSWCFIVWCSC